MFNAITIIRLKKKKNIIMSAKPSIRTQELPKTDLKKFLKRVSTPLGTKTKTQSVISSQDSNIHRILKIGKISIKYPYLFIN